MKYVCDACGWEYDEAAGDPEHGIAPGTKFEDLPDDFECPLRRGEGQLLQGGISRLPTPARRLPGGRR